MHKIVIMLLCLTTVVQAQTLKGVIINAEDQKPVPAASVFLSSTGVGTIAREDGSFEITSFPSGRFDLVVSSVGYETYSTTVQSSALPAFLKILLKPKTKELEEVIVEPYEKNGWERWGKFFLDNFVGISAYAKAVTIKNPGALRFRHSKKKNMLNAYADEPLVIENNALGYVLRYQLEQFEFNFSTNMLFFKGFPLFEPMETKRSRKQRLWEANRADVYEGSLMHFYRALYRNRLVEEGFELRKSVDVVNQEKMRVKAKMAQQMKGAVQQGNKVVLASGEVRSASGTIDSGAYYREVMRQPDKISFLYNTPIAADSVAYAVDSVTLGLYFKDYLHITYPKKKEPIEIARSLGRQAAEDGLVSKLQLLQDKEIYVLANGSFFEPTHVLIHGYWSQWERIATMLPLEYKPARNKKAP